ncbi:glycosyltransferase family 2 protein [Boletus edulis]|nr:glycosyltransferase family 2 protein [Boletus edulis]
MSRSVRIAHTNIPPRQPTSTGTTIRRAKTLTRPERSVAPVPLINPPSSLAPTASGWVPGTSVGTGFDPWRVFSRIVTFWAPSFLLTSLGGLTDKNMIQAWREKIALCCIILVLCLGVAFVTVGTQKVLCPSTSSTTSARYTTLGSVAGTLSVQGTVFNVTNAQSPEGVNLDTLAEQEPGQDITPYFARSASQYTACNGLPFHVATDDPRPAQLLGYDWSQVATMSNYFVLDGAVLNMNPYTQLHPTPILSDSVDLAIRSVLLLPNNTSGKDATLLFYSNAATKSAVPCLIQRYYAGNIDKITPGCFVSSLFLYVGLIVILSLVLVRFAMACVFNWFLSARLAGPPDSIDLDRSAISPAVMPEEPAWLLGQAQAGSKKPATLRKTPGAPAAAPVSPQEPSQVMSLAQIGAELFAVCLVTCYSEGEESVRSTLDSLSRTTYSDHRKLLFVIADGMITGAGEKRSTPDICVSLLEADPRFGNPTPMGYLAVGSGAKRENRALVYAGHYTCAGSRTPTLIIVKCGTEAESTDKKPGNRGKRDSQLILMNFFSRVTYNDRMTPLDFDLFRKIHVLMGVTPDFFEVCLMVDADTKVFPDSLKALVNCMHHDQLIMGVSIQVFEYFISHHLAKGFESVFGGVSCLPGCFSMFRLKARRNSGDDWIPLIIKPEIVREYSQSEVATLHQKNLLLLGEDRFLTTILIRTFPNRKMMFLPQARCRTVVPDTFSVLLSQRRRWINSTIHNLMELVLVRNLCGTFCFSMHMIINPPVNFEEAIPLILLVAVLGLPAVLIVITTRKIVYVFWMLIYLIALPIWNFVLPVYSFWHFDDFSWGETRKVEGEAKGEAHGTGDLSVGGLSVPLRRWEDWERSRLRKLKREERRRKDMERLHPGGFLTSENDLLNVRGGSQYEGSDAYSVASSEDDHWSQQVGGYNESSVQYPPPPVGLHAVSAAGEGGLVGHAQLEAMLDAGFDDSPSHSPARTPTSSAFATRYQLSDNPSQQHLIGRAAPSHSIPSESSQTPSTPAFSPVAHQRDVHNYHSRSRDAYGPLGPLDPGEMI